MNRASPSLPASLIPVWSFISRLGLCASLIGLSALPFASSLAGAALATLLALPLAVLATLFVAACARSPVVALGQRRGFARFTCIAVAGSLVFALGAYVANVGLVDDPLQTATLIACAFAGVAGVVAMLIAHWALRRSRLGQAMDTLAAERVVGPVALGAGLGLIVLDSSFLSEGYLAFHLALLGLATTCLAICAAIFVSNARGRRVASWIALAVVGASAVAIGVSPAQSTYARVANDATLARRLLFLARRALDRDGDGFAAALGGGDCDDHDAKAFPLSSKGRDCLQWVGGRPALARRISPSAMATSASIGPRVILLVTVDALRCDPLRSPDLARLPTLCPKLEQLAGEGRQRRPAHTTYPSTAHATLSLHAGTFYPHGGGGEGALLAELMKSHGRTTHAVSTHSKQMPPVIAQSFDSVDRALQARTSDGSASTSPQVTERTLAWLKSNREQPVFVWAHYYDPHSPYVDPPGSHSALSPAITRYVAEVRRTESEVARLIRAAAALEPDLVALITADHGEEFAEHGNMYHGTTLYEAAVRVPMIAWPVTSRFLSERSELPASIAEVAPFLISIARGEVFASNDEAFFWVASHGKRLLGIYRDSYKLTYDEGLNLTALYNVAEDPAEAHNLAQTHQALRDQLGLRMAAYLAQPVSERQAALPGK
jgi:hypothetical protein